MSLHYKSTKTIFFTLLLSLGLLTGCSTSKDALLPPGDSNMLELWNGGADGASAGSSEARAALRRSLDESQNPALEELQKTYTATAETEIAQQFPRLPNPDIVIYIYPHLVGNGSTPVPGYSSVFPFYTTVQYALPGERTEDL